MEIRTRDVPEQHVVTEQRSADQAALEAWLPGAVAPPAATAAAAGGVLGTTAWPDLDRAGADQPVFDVAFPVAAGG